LQGIACHAREFVLKRRVMRDQLLTVLTEMAGAELKEFTPLDGNQATWSIPPARSKNGRAHVVPLSVMARAIVNELVDIANRRAEELEKREGRVAAARFLLVSPAGDDQPIDGHALSVAMARFGKAFDLKCKDNAQELEHGKAAASWFEDRPTAHDLRRTLATRLAALGVPSEDGESLPQSCSQRRDRPSL
jgi:integrase